MELLRRIVGRVSLVLNIIAGLVLAGIMFLMVGDVACYLLCRISCHWGTSLAASAVGYQFSGNKRDSNGGYSPSYLPGEGGVRIGCHPVLYWIYGAFC